MLASETARFEEVCRFGIERIEPLAHAIAAAFADDPVWQWIIGQNRTLTIAEGLPLARALVADTGPVDEIHGFRHHEAVALWRAPADLETDTHRAWKADRSGPYFAAFADQVGERPALGEFSDALKAARPAEPHWYLSILATSPSQQGQGLGTRVMAPMLARSDRLGIATYLESSNPRNHSFYRRLGYLETEPVSAAGSPAALGFYRRAR